MKRIRTLSILLSSALLLFSPARVNAAQEFIPEDYNGYLEVDYTPDRIYTDVELETLGADLGIPSKYDSREYGYVTGIRDQNPYGTCWSFSTMAALEGSALRQGLASNIDLSEYHLLNYNYQYVVDPLGGTEGDDIIFHGTMADFLNHGGNVIVNYHALANWMGATVDTGYVTDPSYVMPKTVESAYLNDILHLEEVGIMNKNDTIAIKQAIMDYGVITGSYYHHDYYMNYDTGAYYMNDTTDSNHAIAIIGWDDNYSKDNFLDKPSRDGAWLVKNSWGTWFGNDGYFWISYEDTSLQETMCYLVAGPADKYDHNYQYDGSYYLGRIGSSNLIKGANVFQVPATAQTEVLKAISFELYSGNGDYEVQIYLNPTNEADPTSGEALLNTPVKGSVQFAGFYTVEMPEEIVLKPGDTFAVVVALKSKIGDSVYIGTECDMLWGNIEFVASAEVGQSFFADATGEWMDVGEGWDMNVRIKAFTCDSKTTKYVQEEKIRAFVERMYTVALGRAAEVEGSDFYTGRLLAGDSNGACLAESFLCSPEFLNKGYDDAQYVKVLYKTFFDREPASEEVNYWVGQLNGGKTRAFVLSGFVNSVEFDNLCASYGISRGFMREDGKPLNPGIGRFAERMYTVVLERAGEKDGIEFWSLNIANGVCTPKDAAKNFFLSPEYVNKNTSDVMYITTLYKAFMDRTPEVSGIAYWQGVLNNGATREQILEGFADSAEFKGIMASFGLQGLQDSGVDYKK